MRLKIQITTLDMATIYDIKIKTTSAFVAHDETYVKQLLEKFLAEYKDPRFNLGFESTTVKVQKHEAPYKL